MPRSPCRYRFPLEQDVRQRVVTPNEYSKAEDQPLSLVVPPVLAWHAPRPVVGHVRAAPLSHSSHTLANGLHDRADLSL